MITIINVLLTRQIMTQRKNYIFNDKNSRPLAI